MNETTTTTNLSNVDGSKTVRALGCVNRRKIEIKIKTTQATHDRSLFIVIFRF